ncbi:hypothetical protein [Calidifontibacillus erzurumensis]|uniref:hypothetical protein n=1 Tax=Calidifontibacillus erzurumensis TaxID=2741433 RepID=UPI0035B56101
MGKFIILTNKQTFQTKVDPNKIKPIETYSFHFFDEIKAQYTIAEVVDENTKIRLYENYEGKEYINDIRLKFFETFDTIEAAKNELNEIVKASGNSEDSKYTKLVRI